MIVSKYPIYPLLPLLTLFYMLMLSLFLCFFFVPIIKFLSTKLTLYVNNSTDVFLI